jgi:hypothetical protein
MKALLITFLVLTGVAVADKPRKGMLNTYSSLWTNSPFTSKPPTIVDGPIEDPLKDYVLLGVSPIGAGNYRVTMINKKTPDERIMIFSDDKNSDFKILGVTRKPGDPLGTVVKLSSGTTTGTVSYEEKLLTIAPPVQAKPPVPVPGKPPLPVLTPGGEQMRQPRPRVVPPPTPTTSGQSPQAVPQAPSQHGQQRPDRRRN